MTLIRKDHPMSGKCYVVAEALFYAMGGEEKGFWPMQARWQGISHWWVEGPNGQVIDLTRGQFTQPFPYHIGKHRAFLSKKMSVRTKKFLGLK